jgi:glycosyltransferase involved in cell wall biosynthesis
MAKVDILLPFWGDVELFKQAVDSVLQQTEQDWKLLIFDDCYPSKEPKRYIDSLSDSRIKYERHKENLGITKNFNYAIRNATAKYCVMFGCDDVMLPNYLEKALAQIGAADFYQPIVEVINEDGRTYLPLGDKVKRLLQPKRSGEYSGERLATSLCHGNWLYFPSILWKTEIIKRYGFDEKFKIAEDVILELEILIDGGTLYFDRNTTFQYRRFAHSLSSKEKSREGVRFNEEAEVYNQFVMKFQEIGWSKAARAAKLRLTSRLHKAIS